MSDPILQVNVAEWVERAKADPVAYQRRQTVEITLNAIARTAPLKVEMFLKGGILMGLAYDSPRQTTDIDLTTALAVESGVGDEVRKLLDSEFPRAAVALGYADLILKTHSVKLLPKGKFPDAKYPALKLKIVSAKRGTTQEKTLQEGKIPVVIDVDISFKEPLPQIQVLELTGGQELRAYGLDRLIARNEIDDALQSQILNALVVKCRARQLEPMRASLDDPEIKKRAGADWQSMELGEVPDFEGCYTRVSEFYRNLPWPIVSPARSEQEHCRGGHSRELPVRRPAAGPKTRL